MGSPQRWPGSWGGHGHLRPCRPPLRVRFQAGYLHKRRTRLRIAALLMIMTGFETEPFKGQLWMLFYQSIEESLSDYSTVPASHKICRIKAVFLFIASLSASLAGATLELLRCVDEQLLSMKLYNCMVTRLFANFQVTELIELSLLFTPMMFCERFDWLFIRK